MKSHLGAQAPIAKIPKSVMAIAGMVIVGYMFIVYSVIFGNQGIKCSQLSKNTDEASHIAELNDQIAELQKEVAQQAAADSSVAAVVPAPDTSVSVESALGAHRPGLIVLGMHRSGTSIVGGLLNKMGLNAGGPLIKAASDNAKGFFERIDVVLQNDAIFAMQHVDYSYGMHKYDAKLGLKHVLAGEVKFKEGERGLKFLNSAENYPWMLKDPRLCISLRTWLPLLNFVPAILFTYRHPMDVAHSLNTRYEKFPYGRTLRMWYIYNKRAIRQSHDLCRVTTSHQRIMNQPDAELERIYNDLRSCGVPVPRTLSKVEIADFVDPKLQHGKSALKDASCEKDNKSLQIPSDIWQTKEEKHLVLYREVMRVFCAMEDGSAYKYDFHWDDSIQDG